MYLPSLLAKAQWMHSMERADVRQHELIRTCDQFMIGYWESSIKAKRCLVPDAAESALGEAQHNAIRAGRLQNAFGYI